LSRQEILYSTRDLSKIWVSGANIISSTFDSNIISYAVSSFSESASGIFIFSEEIPVVKLKKISLEEAKSRIYRYIKEHPGCRTSDIIMDLELDPDVVLKALSQLQREDRVEGREIE